ncbi:hypothetical protein ACFWVU_22760 [Streptomyces sp. NPDC058686]|uniref:hypothetical protein n=1 Tax=Streptomyces sp. NPDC058686 TaxID=3346599 RepID=UPI00365ABA54
MTNRPHPRLKSLTPAPTGASLAEPGPAPSSPGAPKGVAEGVPTAVRPDPQTKDGRYFLAWLHVTAPRGAIPTATSNCDCGHNRSAIGRTRVLDLIDEHAFHRTVCPLRTPQEGRAAA